jgi:cell division protein FtsW (lipid II flippase)
MTASMMFLLFVISVTAFFVLQCQNDDRKSTKKNELKKHLVRTCFFFSGVLPIFILKSDADILLKIITLLLFAPFIYVVIFMDK